MHRFVSVAAPLLLSVFNCAAQAQDYPSKPIRLLSPLPAGGMVDNFARVLAQHLSEAFKQPVTDVVVHPSVPANSIKEFIELARAQPGKLAFASIGQGTSVNLATEIFMSMAKVDFVHGPYTGTGPAMLDMTAGRVQVMFSGGGTGLPLVEAGKLKLLASTAERRTIATPNTPTVAEAGLPGYESIAWFALVGPAGMSKVTVDRLHREAATMQKSQATIDRFAKVGAEMLPGTPEQLSARIRQELPLFARIMKQAGIQPE